MPLTTERIHALFFADFFGREYVELKSMRFARTSGIRHMDAGTDVELNNRARRMCSYPQVDV